MVSMYEIVLIIPPIHFNKYCTKYLTATFMTNTIAVMCKCLTYGPLLGTTRSKTELHKSLRHPLFPNDTFG